MSAAKSGFPDARRRERRCHLCAALGEIEICQENACSFWEEGGEVLPRGCALERLAIPLDRDPALASELLAMRARPAAPPASGRGRGPAGRPAAPDKQQTRAPRRLGGRVRRPRPCGLLRLGGRAEP